MGSLTNNEYEGGIRMVVTMRRRRGRRVLKSWNVGVGGVVQLL